MKNSLSFESISFRGMREEVVHMLRKAILGGFYAPGQKIYEAELAKTLKLSRGPVREALLQLEKESLAVMSSIKAGSSFNSLQRRLRKLPACE